MKLIVFVVLVLSIFSCKKPVEDPVSDLSGRSLNVSELKLNYQLSISEDDSPEKLIGKLISFIASVRGQDGAYKKNRRLKSDASKEQTINNSDLAVVVQVVSDCYEIDPYVFAATMQHESAFDQWAWSPGAASGLTQFVTIAIAEQRNQLGLNPSVRVKAAQEEYFVSTMQQCQGSLQASQYLSDQAKQDFLSENIYAKLKSLPFSQSKTGSLEVKTYLKENPVVSVIFGAMFIKHLLTLHYRGGQVTGSTYNATLSDYISYSAYQTKASLIMPAKIDSFPVVAIRGGGGRVSAPEVDVEDDTLLPADKLMVIFGDGTSWFKTGDETTIPKDEIRSFLVDLNDFMGTHGIVTKQGRTPPLRTDIERSQFDEQTHLAIDAVLERFSCMRRDDKQGTEIGGTEGWFVYGDIFVAISKDYEKSAEEQRDPCKTIERVRQSEPQSSQPRKAKKSGCFLGFCGNNGSSGGGDTSGGDSDPNPFGDF